MSTPYDDLIQRLANPYQDLVESMVAERDLPDEEARRLYARAKAGDRVAERELMRRYRLAVPGTQTARVIQSPLYQFVYRAIAAPAVRGPLFGLYEPPEPPRVVGDLSTRRPSTTLENVVGTGIEVATSVSTPFAIPFTAPARLLVAAASSSRGRLGAMLARQYFRNMVESGAAGTVYGAVRAFTDPKTRERLLRAQSDTERAAIIAESAGEHGATWAAFSVPLTFFGNALARWLSGRAPKAAPVAESASRGDPRDRYMPGASEEIERVVQDVYRTRPTYTPPAATFGSPPPPPPQETVGRAVEAVYGVRPTYAPPAARFGQAVEQVARRAQAEYGVPAEAVKAAVEAVRSGVPAPAAVARRAKVDKATAAMALEAASPPEVLKVLAPAVDAAVEILQNATPQQLVALRYLKEAKPVDLAKALRGTRATQSNPRALGLNKRHKIEVARKYGLDISQAEKLARYAAAHGISVEEALHRLGETLRQQSGQLTLGILSPGSVMEGHKEALRRAGATPLEGWAASVFHWAREYDEWAAAFERSVKEWAPQIWDDVSKELQPLYRAARRVYAAASRRAAEETLTPVEKLLEAVKLGEGGHAWYDDSWQAIIQAYGPDYAHRFAAVVAVTSEGGERGKKVAQNMSDAIKVWETWIREGVDAVERTVPKHQYKMIRRILSGEDPEQVISGRKILNFYRALTGDPNAVVVDRWMVRAFIGRELDKGESPTDQEYDFIEGVVRQLAHQMGMEPRAFQARVWVAMRAEAVKAGKLRGDPVESFKTLLDRTPTLYEVFKVAEARVNHGKNTPPHLSTPEGIQRALREHEFVIITAQNPKEDRPVTAYIRKGEDPNTNLVRQLTETYNLKAEQIIPVGGYYDNRPEESFIVYGLRLKDAISLARQYGQASIFHSKYGIVDVPVEPKATRTTAYLPTGEVRFGTSEELVATGGYSTIYRPDGQPITFRAEINWQSPIELSISKQRPLLPLGESGSVRLSLLWDAMFGRFRPAPGAPPEAEAIAAQATKVRDHYVRDYIMRTGRVPETRPTVQVEVKKDGTWTFASGLQAFEEAATAFKLTSPLTHERNLLSNVFSGLLYPLEAAVAARSPQAGLQVLAGYGAAFPRAARNLVTALRNELAVAGARANEEAILAMRGKAVERGPVIPGAVGVRIRTPFRLLALADAAVKEVLRSGAIYQSAYRTAVKEGKSGDALIDRMAELVTNPTKEMIEYAERKAREHTFSEDLGEFGRALLMARDAVPGGRLVFPFIITPVNVMKFFLRRTPAGVLTAFKVEGNRIVLREGGEAEEALARSLVGSMLLGLFGWMAYTGVVTGGGPSDPSRRRALLATGWQPYSVRVGNQYISYRGIEPLATFLAAAADTVESFRHDPDKVVPNLTRQLTRSIANATFVNQLSGLLEVTSNPYEAERYIADTAASTVVPAAVGALARTLDPTVRDPQNVWQRFATRVPGLRQAVPAKTDVYGREVRLEGVALLTPPMSAIRSDPLLEEAVRLGVSIPEPSKKVKVRGKEVERTPEKRAEIKRRRAQYYEALSRLVASTAYQRLDDDTKRRVLERWIRKISEAVR